MSHAVVITSLATLDLYGISRWIEDRADARTADRFDARIRRFIARLSSFPNRGSSRSDLGSGLRSITFEGRIVIIYRVAGTRVEIVRVIHGSRDAGRLTFD